MTNPQSKMIEIEEYESELDIAFCCESCDKEIVRDSEEHDHSSCDETGEIWYCQDCPVPEEDEAAADARDKALAELADNPLVVRSLLPREVQKEIVDLEEMRRLNR